MLSDKCNLIMAKATGLIFSLFGVALAGHVPFGTLQYIQCILHGLTSVLLCVPFIFADSKKCDLAVVPFITKIVRIFHSAYFDCSGAF